MPPKPAYVLHYLAFPRVDFAISIGADVRAAVQHAEKKLRVTFNCTEADYQAKGLCILRKNGAVLLAFSQPKLSACLICHEITHATNGIFDHMGLRWSAESEEAWAYHNEQLFRLVAELCQRHNIDVPLTPAF